MLETRRRFLVSGNAKEKAFQVHLDPDTPIPKTPFTKVSSLSLKSVWLYDWWLVKAESNGLAVGGFASRENLGVRAFSSAAIAKRHDTTTLETVDGIKITISGIINRSRTLQNGFPSEICNHFLLGFPHYWEEYANGGIPSKGSRFVEVNTSTGSHADTLQPVSLDDIPATRMRDLMMSPRADFGNSVLKREIVNVLQEFCRSSVQDKSTSNRKMAKTYNQNRPVKGTGKSQRSGRLEKDADTLPHSRHVITRSMTRLKALGNKQEQGLSSKSSVRHDNSAQFAASEASGIHFGRVMTESSERDQAISSHEDEEFRISRSHYISAMRRSNRLKNLKKSIRSKPACKN